ncbi:MAG: IS1634 family transposase [Candidatus Aerophobus sp.]|nr:MAG: IS1634 family transposase [Candidatus Aerophobus sp.]
MFVRETTSKRKHGPDVTYLHLAHNVWDPQRKMTRTQILHSFGRKDELNLEGIRRLVKSLSSYLPLEDQLNLLPKDFRFIWSRQFGHLYLLDYLWKQFGLDDFFTRELARRSFEAPVERAIFSMVAQRAISPSSKLSLVEDWIKNKVYLPGADELRVQHLYRAMDFLFGHLANLEIKIYNQIVDLLSLDVSVIFFDTTSIYFEIEEEDEDAKEQNGLRKFGYSKDHRSDRPQILLGLAINKDGYPVRHWVFPGNHSDVASVKEVVKDLGALRPKAFIFVGDRGLVSEENINFLESRRLRYILGVKGRSDPLAAEVISQKGRFIKVADSLQVKEKIVEDGQRKLRYILCYNPKEARRDRERRDEALTFMQKELSHLQGLSKSLCKLLSHKIYGRYLKLSKNGNIKIDKAKLRQEERLDGKYILSTNDFSLPAGAIAQGYKDLHQIEAAFKSMKHVLDIRPIFHTKEMRIRTHVGICVLAYLLTVHAEKIYGMSWTKIKNSLGSLHVGCISSPQGTFIKTTESTKEQRNIFKKFSIKPPPEILKIL